MIPSFRTRSRSAVAAGALGLSLALFVPLVLAPVSADDSIKEARREREAARTAQIQAAREIDLLTAADADVAAAVETIEAAVVTQEARVEDGRRRLADAHAQLVAREAGLRAAQAQLEASSEQVNKIAVQTYVGKSADDMIEILFTSEAIEAMRKEAALGFLHRSESDALNAHKANKADQDRAVDWAEQALAETERLRAELVAELEELQATLDSQVAARTELQARIVAWRAKQDEMERNEVELTSLIQQRQLEVLKVSNAAPTAESYTGFINPGAGAVGSSFGPRVHPIFGETRVHAGVDFDGRSGDPIWAAKGGRVLFSGTMSGYGNVVIIDHGNGVSSLYAHASKRLVSEGDRVDRGEVVALVGSTGYSTGPHLHFEVRVSGVAKDPMLFLP